VPAATAAMSGPRLLPPSGGCPGRSKGGRLAISINVGITSTISARRAVRFPMAPAYAPKGARTMSGTCVARLKFVSLQYTLRSPSWYLVMDKQQVEK